jgi:threonyl-tRNA synthetase
MMINVTFPDGSVREYNSGISGLDITTSISKSLAKDALFVRIDEEDYDLSRPILKDCNIKIFTKKDPEGLELIRHDTAHILAEAIK